MILFEVSRRTISSPALTVSCVDQVEEEKQMVCLFCLCVLLTARPLPELANTECKYCQGRSSGVLKMFRDVGRKDHVSAFKALPILNYFIEQGE